MMNTEQAAQEPSGAPLAGLRVVEAGVLLAGPYAGQLLGDLGAEVIKVEMPSMGDPMRQWFDALWWPIVGRNKKSVELDLRCEAGQAAFKRLVQEADILIENFRPGTLEAWGLGYEQLSALNPGLIMLRTSGFGQTGPYARRAAYASTGEAMGGLRYVVGFPDRPPPRLGLSIGDSLAGLYSTVGALAALRERDRSGRGQVVDTAIYESVLACTEAMVPEYTVEGRVRQRMGSTLKGIAPSNVYPTADGELIIAANQDTLFPHLCEAMGRPELASDPRFATHHARAEHQELLDGIVADWTRGFPTAQLQAILDRHGIVFGAIYRVPDMLDDPHFQAREAIVKAPCERGQDFAMPNVMPRLTRTPGQIRWTGPRLGEHNEEVLAQMLGMNLSEMLAAQGRQERERP